MEVSYKYDRPTAEERPESSSPAFLVATIGPGALRLLGELDIAAVPTLRAMLANLEGDIELDCARLTFIDCFGLRVLEETQRACETAGVRLRLTAPSRCLTRLLELVELDGFFDVRHGPDR